MSLENVHRDTPSLTVADPRGLAVRAIQYHRRQAADPVEMRVTHQRFDAAGRPVASRDPYLFALAQDDASVPANLSQVFSLSGVPLASDSVDAGWRVALHGAAGQGIETWDGRGSHSLTEFDELLRPVAVHERGEFVAEHVLERFSYAGVDADAVSRNLCGQLIRHDDPAGTLHLRELGIAGAVLQQTRHFLLETDPVNWPDNVPARDALVEPDAGATTSHAYAPTTELLQQIDALGNRQDLAYTVAGELKNSRLTLTGDGQPERTLVSELHYSATGQIESETAGNGVITRHHYDPADGRLIGLSAHKANGTQLQNLKYRYDAAGNVLSLEDAAQPIRYFNNQRIEPLKTYCYDTLYQLIEATGWEAKTGHGGPALPDLQPLPLDPNQVAQYTQTYHYDAGGNLLDLKHVGAQAHGRTLTRARFSNRCLPERNGRPPTEAELDVGFDANGNLRELQAGQSMDWDLRNQLSSVCPVVREDGTGDYERYLYDGGGQRLRKVRATRSNARTLISEVRYLPGVEIRSHSGTGEVLHVITASAGSNSVLVLHWVAKPPENIPNDQVRYSLNDHLQSSTLELDQNADLISHEWYYPFGGTACFAARSAVEAKYKTVRYSGKERDATGLYYYGFRYYAPWLQRWINPDPAGYVDGINLYAMVGNNPITYLDSRGSIREDFNAKQYLYDFKRQLDGFRSPLFYSDNKLAKHYRKKLLNIADISNEKQQKYFKKQIEKLWRVTNRPYSSFGPGFAEEFLKLHPFLKTAWHFDPFENASRHQPGHQSSSGSSTDFRNDDSYQWGYQRERTTGASGSHHSSGTSSSRGYENERQRHPGSSKPRHPGQSNSSSSSQNAHGSQNTGSFSNTPPSLSAYPTLPPDTDEKIISSYDLAVRIINNAKNERAIFKDGMSHKDYKRTSLLIHPDKLSLEGAPHVGRAATEAFKIISSWKDRRSS